MDTQMCAKANTAQCLPHLHNFSTFMYIWMFHNKKLGGGGGRRQADLVVMLWLWDGLAMGIHEKGFWETMQHAAQPASHSLYQRPPSTCSMLQQKVVAHYHPTLAKIPESQAGMRLSSGSWWGPWSRRRLMRYHLNPWEVLARRGLHLHPKLIYCLCRMTWISWNRTKKSSISSPIPQKSMGPEPVSTFFLPVHKAPHNRMASSVAKMNARCWPRSQGESCSVVRT